MKDENTPTRKLKVDISELAFAYENTPSEASHFLDLETGEIVLVTDEINQELERIYDEYIDETKESLNLLDVLQTLDFHDWQKEELIKADQVKAGMGKHYLQIPGRESREGWLDMEEFIDTVKNLRLRERLAQAIHGRGPFRAFKNILQGDPTERQRWFQFKDTRLRQRVLDWLESEGIEPDLND